MKKLDKPGLIKFLILAFLFFLTVKTSFLQLGILKGAHVAFLIWTFFILCTPVARGKFFIRMPIYYLTGRSVNHPEIFTWLIALTGNMLTLAVNPDTYFQTSITHLLYVIMHRPWPFWLVISVCGIATFYDSLFCSYTTKKTNKKHQLYCHILLTISFITTFFLTYNELVLIINIHGGG